MISSKNTCYLAALQNLVITQNNTEQITEIEAAPCPSYPFHSNWSQYPGYSRFDLKTEISFEL